MSGPLAAAAPLRLATARLTLRPLVRHDFEEFYRTLVLDSSVMQFYHAYRNIGSDAERRARAARDFFDHFDDGARRFGYVCWAMTGGPALGADAGRLVGWAGVVTPALESNELGPEVAYMIGGAWQGGGLTTEAVDAVIRDAFSRYGLVAIHAVMDRPNVASRRVVEKLGFAFRGPVSVYGSDEMVLYLLKRADVQRAGQLDRLESPGSDGG